MKNKKIDTDRLHSSMMKLRLLYIDVYKYEVKSILEDVGIHTVDDDGKPQKYLVHMNEHLEMEPIDVEGVNDGYSIIGFTEDGIIEHYNNGGMATTLLSDIPVEDIDKIVDGLMVYKEYAQGSDN